MGKYLSAVAFGGLVVFTLWVLIADRPLDRINRTCTPATWVTKSFATIGSLFSSKGETKGASAGEDLYQTCRYFVFRQFYADAYAEMLRREQAEAAAAAGSDGDGARAAE